MPSPFCLDSICAAHAHCVCHFRNSPLNSQSNLLGKACCPVSSDILTIREVSNYLKINEKTAYRLASEGKLPGFKVGGAWRFRRDEIEKLTKGAASDDERSGPT